MQHCCLNDNNPKNMGKLLFPNICIGILHLKDKKLEDPNCMSHLANI
jgi:hypothetical protein